MDERQVLIGRVLGAFGVKGEIRILCFGEDPKALLSYKILVDRAGAAVLTLSGGRASKDVLIARTVEVADKDAADALRGTDLYVPRSRLPEAEEDEFYLADLIGMTARSPEGAPLGRVRAVPNYGAGDLLEIEPEDAPTFLVPFTKDLVPEVKIGEGVLVVIRPREVE